MVFSKGRWLLSRFELGVFLLTPSLPGIVYEPNMIEEQSEQHKLIPKRIQEHTDALVRDHALGGSRI